MTDHPIYVVTGAFGYSGQYIARRLLARGIRVRTLTNSPKRANLFAGQVEIHPFRFDDQAALSASLEGADVLINTYWVRFDHRDFTHEAAVQNTLRLFEAATRAGIRRVVHVSITNPSDQSALPYFRGKAELERALAESGLSYAILRPTVLFGDEDILVNNIAWCLRRFPLFGVFGDGSYRLQPVYVDDLAALAVEQCTGSASVTMNAIGPETYSFGGLVETIAGAVGVRPRIVGVPPTMALWTGRMIGALMGDVMITRDEMIGLMEERLYTESAPSCPTRFSDWVSQHGSTLGRHYASELARRRDRDHAYGDLGSLTG